MIVVVRHMMHPQTLGFLLILAGFLCVLAKYFWSWIQSLRLLRRRRSAGMSGFPYEEARLRSSVADVAREMLLLAGAMQVLSGFTILGGSTVSTAWLVFYSVLLVLMLCQLLVSARVLLRAIGDYLAISRR